MIPTIGAIAAIVMQFWGYSHAILGHLIQRVHHPNLKGCSRAGQMIRFLGYEEERDPTARFQGSTANATIGSGFLVAGVNRF